MRESVLLIAKKLIMLFLIFNISILHSQQKGWTGDWKEIYTDSDIKVEVMFYYSLESCQPNGKQFKYKYRLNGKISNQYKVLHWTIRKINCNGNSKDYMCEIPIGGSEAKNSLGSLQLSDMVIQTLDYQFTCKEIKKEVSQVRVDKNQNSATNNDQPTYTPSSNTSKPNTSNKTSNNNKTTYYRPPTKTVTQPQTTSSSSNSSIFPHDRKKYENWNYLHYGWGLGGEYLGGLSKYTVSDSDNSFDSLIYTHNYGFKAEIPFHFPFKNWFSLGFIGSFSYLFSDADFTNVRSRSYRYALESEMALGFNKFKVIAKSYLSYLEAKRDSEGFNSFDQSGNSQFFYYDQHTKNIAEALSFGFRFGGYVKDNKKARVCDISYVLKNNTNDFMSKNSFLNLSSWNSGINITYWKFNGVRYSFGMDMNYANNEIFKGRETFGGFKLSDQSFYVSIVLVLDRFM